MGVTVGQRCAVDGCVLLSSIPDNNLAARAGRNNQLRVGWVELRVEDCAVASEIVFRPVGHVKVPDEDGAVRVKRHGVVLPCVRGQQELGILGREVQRCDWPVTGSLVAEGVTLDTRGSFHVSVILIIISIIDRDIVAALIQSTLHHPGTPRKKVLEGLRLQHTFLFLRSQLAGLLQTFLVSQLIVLYLIVLQLVHQNFHLGFLLPQHL
mmetsp:Transcript_15359/g.30192  ORF Transcript_15359/g.30192 Transcript_15359/m.30192 type:complete len:209 (-) Transcript_15359:423-1049(-)